MCGVRQVRRRDLEDRIAIELQRAEEQEERAVAAALEANLCNGRMQFHKERAEQLRRDLEAMDRFDRERGEETA